MSVLCLICKDKLLGYSSAPGSAGSLNTLSEHIIIATSCGHLYHWECLQSWFQTQKRKLQNLGYGETESLCPSCQSEVKEENHRRIFPVEDYKEALEKAKLLEKQENMEIYNHQLELQIQQLTRENDILINKVLAPSNSSSPIDEYDTIVKNDRVVWMRKNDLPLGGIVLSIFKKDSKLCAKIKLDRKIRTNQRTNRLFSSFRTDKTQELTVPFEEIVLEKDFNLTDIKANNEMASQAMGLKSLSSANLYHPPPSSPLKYGSFRNSTLSLPGDSISRGLGGIQESADEGVAETSGAPRNTKITRSISLSPEYQISRPYVYPSASPSRIASNPKNINVNVPPSLDDELDQQRDYVYITPSWMKAPIQIKSENSESRSSPSPPDCKNKHVTFADQPRASIDSETTIESSVNSETQSETHDLQLSQNKAKGVAEKKEISNSDQPPSSPQTRPMQPSPRKKQAPPPPLFSELPELSASDSDSINSEGIRSPERNESQSPTLTETGIRNAKVSNVKNHSADPQSPIPTVRISTYETITRMNIPIADQRHEQKPLEEDGISVFNLIQDFEDIPPSAFATSCYDITLLSLLFGSNAFDPHLLVDSLQDNEFCRQVKWIVREKFANPLRFYGVVHADYAALLKESINHLSSGSIDVEELLTILFEFTYKMNPFINYSLEMCDYIHQFFIDFTDKSKFRSVQQLLEKSLFLQDSLKLEGYPSPALILQMPHSEGKIIHYNAVKPSLTLNMDSIINKDDRKEVRKCYCNNPATLECKTCSEIHGNSALLFCNNCRDLLNGIHDEDAAGHEVRLSQIPPEKFLTSSNKTMSLSAIISVKENVYHGFFKEGTDTFGHWVYVHGIIDGKLQMKDMPGFGYWLNSLTEEKLANIQQIPSLLRTALQNCRVFVYLPVISTDENSSAV